MWAARVHQKAPAPAVPSVKTTRPDVSLKAAPERLAFAKENRSRVSWNSRYSLC